ncbi:MAG: amino acid ABC transporter ATP-binding protein, partial [Bauldia sp.]|nr:amino acid ABC transporter ATP-binding protein [Bauldia sp.]
MQQQVAADAASQDANAEVAINIADMNKWYGDFHVLKNINLQVGRGERIVICGPSGSGKSTILRCVNGLESYQKGDILVEGARVDRSSKMIGLIRRRVSMVFQRFNLFPHRTA